MLELARLALLVAAAAALAACASKPQLPLCKLEVSSLEEYLDEPENVVVAYRVRGDAGSEAMLWLAAKTAEGAWISGDALEVGPGAFAAIIDVKLTGRAAKYKAVLEVAGHRCGDDAPDPGS